MKKNQENRRQFLKNTSLAALSVGFISNSCEAKSSTSSHKKPPIECEKTTLDYYGAGPFYTENPPSIENNKLSTENETGTPLIISGRVFNLDCNEFIPNVVIDIWHANDEGAYDNDGYNLRGITHSNSQGFFMFETILPGKYGSRPRHIHFKITPPGFETLVTQIYFEGDTSIPSDNSASITSGQYDASARIISLEENQEGKMEGIWNIVMQGDGISGVADLHPNKGMIYQISPNPFSNKIDINYGVFQKAKITLLVFDMSGHQVAILEEQTLSPKKYTAVWQPDSSLPDGTYFVALKVNELQVHYLKIVRRK